MQQKTVFISYRRKISKHLARSIYQDLKMNGWDVFLDVNTIDSGDFDKIILNQIAARAHFILLISKGALERCANKGDWVLREIEEAVRLKRNIVPIIEEDAKFTEEIAYLPEDLRAIIAKKNALPLPHFFFDPAMEMLRTRFLKTPEYVTIQETPTEDKAEVERRIEQAEADTDLADESVTREEPAKVNTSSHVATPSTSLDLMPEPFDWIEIPNKDYSIAKYPITNAQFRKFVEADGYENERWWTEQGRQVREEKKWREPRYWREARWNMNLQPVVGISWYEAVAFCLWLSETTGEKIMLPTSEQWQYAAQGDKDRLYPWGNTWKCTRCSNSVNPCKSQKTTSVTDYEGKGDSFFGVVGMAGNVWEWCLTDYYHKTNNDIHSNVRLRVFRGGSWNNHSTSHFRCDRIGRNFPLYRDNLNGFRIVRNHS